jgi:putative DNA primase/helicase
MHSPTEAPTGEFALVTIFRRVFRAAESENSSTGKADNGLTGDMLVPIGAAHLIAPTQPESFQAGKSAEHGAALLDAIAVAARRHVVPPDGAAEMTALFVMHCHAHDAAQFSPILAITSPDSGCGKTTLMRLLQALTPAPLLTANATTAGLYRQIAWRKPTLILDEGDSFIIGNNELRGILNAGHCRDSARVVRSDGNFDVWCPKIIGLIGELPVTLRNRSLKIVLNRKRADERVARIDKTAIAGLEKLRDRVARWAADHHARLAIANPMMPAAINNRGADNWAPLFAIADAAGAHWPERARRLAVMALADTNPDSSPGIVLLGDIRSVFHAKMADRIMTAELIAALTAMEDRPWGEWSRRRPITAAQIAKILSPWRISPKTFRFGIVTAKGYALVDFADSFARYL